MAREVARAPAPPSTDGRQSAADEVLAEHRAHEEREVEGLLAREVDVVAASERPLRQEREVVHVGLLLKVRAEPRRRLLDEGVPEERVDHHKDELDLDRRLGG